MSAPDVIKDLIERFPDEKNDLNETQVRQSFIDPLFDTLGWDVSSKRMRRQAQREVVLEDSIKVDDATKAPDYGFYLGGARKFFVEAKAPWVPIDTHVDSAFQLRRYGWSANLPVSILTDFEEFAIYDCRVQPSERDAATTARIEYLRFDEFEERWGEVEGLFSKEAVRAGSLERFIGDFRQRGADPVDRAFLRKIEGWRELLAKDIFRRNPSLDRYELNYAVQATIDRIVFLRVCEDRGVEEYGRLEKLIEGGGIYPRLADLFKDADDRYNSGLFHFRKEGERENPDDLTLGLGMDDGVLREMIGDLYYPRSPYQFSVMPVEILGQTYEQFLGKVITIEEGRGEVAVEEKPEVRKAGGVYYTPSYIVDYIVGKTVGKLVEGKTPRQVANLKIVDPACGSGSFLIGAYDHLLDWHLRRYVEDGPEKHEKEIYEYRYATGESPGDVAGEWRLKVTEKKRILLKNIHGVDIDSQAVEVTKLSLLLKVLEGETSETVDSQLSFFSERVLPDLDGNIKSGNSLIGHDFYDNEQMSFLDEDEQRRINTFDWEAGFKEVFSRKNPGFDAVIGNPPYDVMEKQRGAASWPHDALASYVRIRPEYEQALGGKLNLFRFFIVRSLYILRNGGWFGMIIPMSLLADKSTASTRRRFLLASREATADCFPQKDNPNRRIFRDAKLSTAVIVCKESSETTEKTARIRVRTYPGNSFEDNFRESVVRLKDAAMLDPKNFPIPLVDKENWKLCKKLHSDKRVSRLGDVEDFNSTRGEINQTTYRKYITDDDTKARLLKGAEVGKYWIREKLSQGNREWFDEARFLSSNKRKSATDYRRIATQRITGVDERLRIVATLMDPPAYFADSTNSIALEDSGPHSLEYLLGLLNSQLFQWRFKLTSTNNNVATNELDSMPIRTIDFSAPEDVARHDRMVSLVEQMIGLRERLSEAKTPPDRSRIQGRIEGADRRIDELVYELYGLTEEEIRLVEGAK